jgi:hypothetical protein
MTTGGFALPPKRCSSGFFGLLVKSARRFPPPWSVEEQDTCGGLARRGLKLDNSV